MVNYERLKLVLSNLDVILSRMRKNGLELSESSYFEKGTIGYKLDLFRQNLCTREIRYKIIMFMIDDIISLMIDCITDEIDEKYTLKNFIKDSKYNKKYNNIYDIVKEILQRNSDHTLFVIDPFYYFFYSSNIKFGIKTYDLYKKKINNFYKL